MYFVEDSESYSCQNSDNASQFTRIPMLHVSLFLDEENVPGECTLRTRFQILLNLKKYIDCNYTFPIDLTQN